MLACGLVSLQGLVYRVQEIAVQERLQQKLNGAGLHGPHRDWHIAVTSNKDYRNLSVGLRHPLLEIEPVQVRKPHIQYQTAWFLRPGARQEPARGGKCLHFESS